MDEETAGLLKRVATELNGAGAEKFVVKLSAKRSFGLLATLQLALRHPQNKGPTAEYIRDLAGVLEAWLGQFGPAVQQLIAMGWDARYDQEVEP